MSVYKYIEKFLNYAVHAKMWAISKMQLIHSLVGPHTISRCKQCPQYRKSTLWYNHTLYPDTNNIQSTANPLSDRSRQCIQFTPTKVHNIV